MKRVNKRLCGGTGRRLIILFLLLVIKATHRLIIRLHLKHDEIN